MPSDRNLGTDIYAVVDRLIRLRDVLRVEPLDMSSILEKMSVYYTHDDSGKRQLRRDIRNLEELGYECKKCSGKWSITTGSHILSNDDIRTLTYIREIFTDKHPLASRVQTLIDHLTNHLSDKQKKLWKQRTALRMLFNPAIDYGNCERLIYWLEEAIISRRQIGFLYCAKGSVNPRWHPRLDPYDIEYVDRQFQLIAFSYEFRTVLTFRLDRIVQNTHSPQLLASMQQLRREQKPILFTYRLPKSFADGGVSERFTIHAVETNEHYVIVKASDVSEFRIIRVLLGYGEHALLLDGPTTLMEKMRDVVAKMSALYNLHSEDQ